MKEEQAWSTRQMKRRLKILSSDDCYYMIERSYRSYRYGLESREHAMRASHSPRRALQRLDRQEYSHKSHLPEDETRDPGRLGAMRSVYDHPAGLIQLNDTYSGSMSRQGTEFHVAKKNWTMPI